MVGRRLNVPVAPRSPLYNTVWLRVSLRRPRLGAVGVPPSSRFWRLSEKLNAASTPNVARKSSHVRGVDCAFTELVTRERFSADRTANDSPGRRLFDHPSNASL